jgi:hypothetical protein
MISGLGIPTTEKSPIAPLALICLAELDVSFCTMTADRNADGTNFYLEIFK